MINVVINIQSDIALIEKLIYICDIIKISNHYVHTTIIKLIEYCATR